MSAIDDYNQNGGMAGFAQRLLQEQLIQARTNKGHIFRGVVMAMQRGNHKSACEKLITVLRNLPEDYPLSVVKLCFVTLPAIRAAISEAADRIDDEVFQESLPKKIATWGTMEAQARADEPMVQSGKKYSTEQSEKARKKRPRKNNEGLTLDDVISKLAKEHPDELPGDLWPHLKTAIDEWSGSDCTEVRPDEKKHDSWLYNFSRDYDSKGEPILGRCSYQNFRKKLSKIENGK